MVYAAGNNGMGNTGKDRGKDWIFNLDRKCIVGIGTRDVIIMISMTQVMD